jgi:hypothetical protein
VGPQLGRLLVRPEPLADGRPAQRPPRRLLAPIEVARRVEQGPRVELLVLGLSGPRAALEHLLEQGQGALGLPALVQQLPQHAHGQLDLALVLQEGHAAHLDQVALEQGHHVLEVPALAELERLLPVLLPADQRVVRARPQDLHSAGISHAVERSDDRHERLSPAPGRLRVLPDRLRDHPPAGQQRHDALLVRPAQRLHPRRLLHQRPKQRLVRELSPPEPSPPRHARVLVDRAAHRPP